MKPLYIYIDTSVFGGCFDEEFKKESRQLFKEISQGRFNVVISDTSLRELANAPKKVRDVLGKVPKDQLEFIEPSEEIIELRDAYIEAEILGKSSIGDAEHIASASVADVDFVVSWNFKHIVHFDKISAYQGVNLLKGYKAIKIYSPKEVVEP